MNFGVSFEVQRKYVAWQFVIDNNLFSRRRDVWYRYVFIEFLELKRDEGRNQFNRKRIESNHYVSIIIQANYQTKYSLTSKYFIIPDCLPIAPSSVDYNWRQRIMFTRKYFFENTKYTERLNLFLSRKQRSRTGIWITHQWSITNHTT